MNSIELGIDRGAIGAQVATARLGALQGAGGDRTGEGVRVAEQLT